MGPPFAHALRGGLRSGRVVCRSGEGAAVVAGDQGAALFLRHSPAAAAEVDGYAVVHDDGGEVAVAREPSRGGDGQWPVWGMRAMSLSPNRSDSPSGFTHSCAASLRARSAAFTCSDRWAARRPRWGGVAGVEVAAQDFGEGIGSLSRRRGHRRGRRPDSSAWSVRTVPSTASRR